MFPHLLMRKLLASSIPLTLLTSWYIKHSHDKKIREQKEKEALTLIKSMCSKHVSSLSEIPEIKDT